MKLTHKILTVAGLFASLMPLMASAATANVPKYVNFQSVLRDDAGNLVEDGFVDMQFRILDQDQDVVYEETQPGVQVVRSAINVMIGEGVKPGSSPATPTGGISVTDLDPEKGTHFLQVQFGSNQASDPMELGSVPYAMYAGVALGISPNITEAEIPPAFVSQGELTTFGTDSDAKYVNVTGDTMTGSLTMNGGNIVMTGTETVDGVDVSSLNSTVSGHTTSISNLNTTVSGHTTAINNLNTTISDHETRITNLETTSMTTCAISVHSNILDGSTADVTSDNCECRVYGMAVDFGTGATAMAGLASVTNIQDDGVSEKGDQNNIMAIKDDSPSKVLFLLAHSCDNNPSLGGLAIGLVPGNSCPSSEQTGVTLTLITHKAVQSDGACIIKTADINAAKSTL